MRDKRVNCTRAFFPTRLTSKRRVLRMSTSIVTVYSGLAAIFQIISGNQGMRCENCPSRGCYECPMFSVGNNPEYAKRKVR